MTEAELAAKVVAWLEGGWDVYEEVALWGGIADLVAVQAKPRRGWLIECKVTLGLAVLSQCRGWQRRGLANYVSCAVPAPRRGSNARHLAMEIAEHFGIGVLVVGRHGVKELSAPRLQRRVVRSVCDFVRPEHKTHAKAGSAKGGYWTAFKQTCSRAVRFVTAHPGCTVGELVKGIDHHYANASSARGALAGRIMDGTVKGIRADTGHPRRLWPSTKAPAL